MPTQRTVRPKAHESLQAALDLFGSGEDVVRQNLRRAHPTASEAEIELRLCAWLRSRPGAKRGDAVERSHPMPR